MNAMLFCAVSAGLMVAALPVQPAPFEQPELVGVAVRAEARLSAAERAAADDAEVARLMAAAPDVGTFGDSVIADPETGIETRISGIGFQDN